MIKSIFLFYALVCNSFAGNLSALVGSGGGGGSGLTFSGYTPSLYSGDSGGTKGMNAACHSAFSGSHACTYDEIIKLGNSYPYSDNAWVIDGAYTAYNSSGTTY